MKKIIYICLIITLLSSYVLGYCSAGSGIGLEGESCDSNCMCSSSAPYCWAYPSQSYEDKKCHAEPARKGYLCSGTSKNWDDDCEGAVICADLGELGSRCSECEGWTSTHAGLLAASRRCNTSPRLDK